MNHPLLRAALLLGAARAPLSAFEALRDRYGSDALETGGEALLGRLELRPAVRARLEELLRDRDWADRELERTEAAGARFLTIDDQGYPPRLKDLPQPPIGLYVRGAFDFAPAPSVAVVGTRKCSPYAKSVGEALGRALARSGYLVVSGGARGVDAAGHSGCLAENGRTVAILGTAVNRVYPSEHRDLFARIAERGALVSEYPMDTGGDPWRFPERNRIIVGMAGRVVVVESPEDGGAMITARLALDIGREVWCVPGRITETVSKGTNRLLRDGAEPLIDVEEFVQNISGRYGQLMLDLGESAPNAAPELSTDEKIVLALLQRQGGRTTDELMAESGLDLATLQGCLMTLSAAGLAVPAGPGRYSAGA
ncbi:MAG: DNA-processing protein DprA [Fretibacterium sp.]|nr:DNA-processing protein DprA [Fretibacterium sp.]